MDNKLLAVAGGQQPADIVIKNGKIVNVLTAEIYDGGVAIVDQTIAAVGDVDYCIGEGTQVVDAQGMFITPGFIDGHIHPESSDLAIRSFAEGVLKHGTTSIMTDLHEVGVVSGIEGIEAVLKENEATDLNLYFVLAGARDQRRLIQPRDHPQGAPARRRGRHLRMRRTLHPRGLPRPYGVARRRRRHEGHDRSGSFGGDEGRGPEQVRGRRRVHLP